MVPAGLGKDPISKINRRVAQGLDCFPTKGEGLSSNPSTNNNNKKKKQTPPENLDLKKFRLEKIFSKIAGYEKTLFSFSKLRKYRHN
jgi:hypothetical protein